MTEHSVPGSIEDPEDLGFKGLPFCREPWESYYILRRGILPCCHGNPVIAPMKNWEAAWNSPPIQEIRDYIIRGKLSPYCLNVLGCPIVQRYMRQKKKEEEASILPLSRHRILRAVNRLLFRIPGKIYCELRARRTRRKYS